MMWAAIAAFAPGAEAGPRPGDVYHSPLRNFDITIPKFPGGTKVQETHDPIHGHVAFAGGAGDMNRIAYQRFDARPLPATIGPDSILALSRAALAGLDSMSRASLVANLAGLDASARAALLANLDRWVPGVNLGAHGGGVVPESAFVGLVALAFQSLGGAQDQLMAIYRGRIVSREAVVRDSTLMILTVFAGPSESGGKSMATGKPLDTVYAHLVLFRRGFLYSLVTRPNDYATGLAASHPGHVMDELAPAARRLTLELYERVTFH